MRGAPAQPFVNGLALSVENPYIVRKEKGASMPQEPARTARIEARISPEALAFVRRAAQIQGRSVSDFVTAAAQDAAQRTIEATQVIRVSLDDQRAFVEAILDPPEPTPALRRAFQRRRELIQTSR